MMHARTPLLAWAVAAALGLLACTQSATPSPESTPVENRANEPLRPGLHLRFAIDLDALAAVRGVGDGYDRDALLSEAQGDAMIALRHRVGDRGVVLRRGDEIAVEIPGTGEAELEALRDDLRKASMSIQLVDDGSAFMQKLAAHVATDEAAEKLGVGVDDDHWRDFESGAEHHERFLVAADRAVLERYLDELGAAVPELSVPADHHIGYQHREAAPPNQAATVRTYYLFAKVELDGSAVADAQVTRNEMTASPDVLVTLDRAGRERFAELTGRSIGRKLAIVVDGRVVMAPRVMSQIPGGQLVISLGGPDPEQRLVDATELARSLRASSLPSWLSLASEARIGPAREPATTR